MSMGWARGGEDRDTGKLHARDRRFRNHPKPQYFVSSLSDKTHSSLALNSPKPFENGTEVPAYLFLRGKR